MDLEPTNPPSTWDRAHRQNNQLKHPKMICNCSLFLNAREEIYMSTIRRSLQIKSLSSRQSKKILDDIV